MKYRFILDPESTTFSIQVKRGIRWATLRKEVTSKVRATVNKNEGYIDVISYVPYRFEDVKSCEDFIKAKGIDAI